jgi:hypothetical protein
MQLSVSRRGEVFAVSNPDAMMVDQASLMPGGTSTSNSFCTTCATTFVE